MNRKVHYSINLFLSLMMVTVIIIVLGLILSNHQKQWDLTQNQRYSLAPQSVDLMRQLAKPIKILAFYGFNQNQDRPKDLLEQYRYHSKLFSYQFIDPDKNPQLTKNYGITYYPCIIVEGEGKSEKLTSLNEQALTNAILKMTRESKKTVGFLSGHGEKNLDAPGPSGLSKAREAMELEGYTVKELPPLTQQALYGIDALIIAGASHNCLPLELDVLKSYLSRGGRIFWALDPGTPGQIDNFLKNYGIVFIDRMIIDPYSAAVGANYYEPMAAKYGSHQITEGFRLASFFPLCRPLQNEKGPAGSYLVPLAFTGPGTWAIDKNRKEENGRPKIFPKQDIRGPFTLLLAGSYQMDHGQKEARMVVLGDSDFLSNYYINLMGNKDLFLNCVGWLTQQENAIAIRPKTQNNNLMFMTTASQKILITTCFALPILAFMTALALWNIRRR